MTVRTVSMIVNYDPKTFIVQATGAFTQVGARSTLKYNDQILGNETSLCSVQYISIK